MRRGGGGEEEEEGGGRRREEEEEGGGGGGGERPQSVLTIRNKCLMHQLTCVCVWVCVLLVVCGYYHSPISPPPPPLPTRPDIDTYLTCFKQITTCLRLHNYFTFFFSHAYGTLIKTCNCHSCEERKKKQKLTRTAVKTGL